MTGWLEVLVLTGSGLTAGVLFAVAISVVPMFLALPPADYVAVHRLVGRHFDRVMPPVVLLSALGGLVLAGRTGELAHLAAALCLAGVSAVSQLGNVPINRRVKSLAGQQLPVRWVDPRRRWRGWHLLRTGLAVLALLLNAYAVAH
ncbi:DUF1772 domain-containing protein [Crossiella sp. SN42]|uniref:DUF1772 domain-containing protein n=1 Tax=Crossiella sp. SN42 TaxID=2944808 RepID=UPI00207CA6F1|nr:DUF1772 domain-containing protein [Crossiella sp. SN42]MCO1580354.1 DUF1772 domain-containing protein [Crossiella sp. SN42]